MGDVVAPVADALLPIGNEAFSSQKDQGESSVSLAEALTEKRNSLAEEANNLIYAESADQNDFLVTHSLYRLISTHRTDLPVEIVVGSKGSGKTFTFLQMCYRQTWKNFAKGTGVEDVEVDAPIVPVLTSGNLHDSVTRQVEEIRDTVIRAV